MESEKKVSIHFNYNFHMQSQRVLWLFSFRKVRDEYILHTVIAAMGFAGVMAINKGVDNWGNSIFGGYLFYMIMIWSGLFKRRNKMERQFKALAKRFDAVSTFDYTFTDDRVVYEDHEKLFSLRWELFKPFEVYKDHLMLIAKDTGAVQIMLSRAELGDEDYFQIKDLLKAKLGDLYISMSEAKKAAGK